METIEKFISNTFEIDCIDICLTQKTEKEPIIYSGPGTIYQDENSSLQLKLYSKLNDIQKTLSHQFKHHAPGKIIAYDNYFTLKAIDMSGKEWVADNISVSSNVSFPASGQVVKSMLREIETIEDGSTTEKNYLFIIVPGEHEIPCNEKEDLPNGGCRLNRSIFVANNINFEFKKLNNCLIITANSAPDYLIEDTYIKILEALSIITGTIIHPVVVENTQQDHAILKINSITNSYSNKKFPIPFKHSTPKCLQSFSSFFEKYTAAINSPFSDLFGFWHKVNRAWQANIENSSLSLGVAIEGIIKTYFRELGLPDKDITKQAEEAKQKLNDMDIGERIKRRLLSSIDDLLRNTSPKSALYQMVQDGLVSKKMAKAWSKLRNKSVHPTKLNEDTQAFQKYIDQIYACIALFFRLLFIIIKYDGNYIDYSENGWPEAQIHRSGKFIGVAGDA
ncbi:MAG: hypothetical protein HYV59_04925 [Planctomycetes bacterium]|nr:hypothetical protein [Planctomycetota bacterium]